MIRQYPCPRCGHITALNEEGDVRRRQIDCPKCETEATVNALPDDEVRVYVTRRRIGEHFYAEHICARSLEEARETAAKFGPEVEGTLEEVRCGNCLAPVVGALVGARGPTPERDDWPEELDG